MAWVIYDNFRLNMMDGDADNVDFSTAGDDIKVSLHTVTYVPNQATHDFWNDATNEVVGTNYTAGGESLATKTLVLAAGTVTFDAADTTWVQNAGGFANARHVVLYFDSTVDTTSPLIATHDMVSDKGNVAGDLVLQYDAAGLITSP